MKDGIGRKIDYLRISITDKCNLRCQYCMPKEGVQLMPHSELLTFEEITRVCRILAKMGVCKVRVTGGEPLVRKDITKLIQSIHEISGIEDISMTTNGVLFAPMAEDLYKAGLRRINLSLDTLDAQQFYEITGKDALEEVLSAVEQAKALSMKLKINCIACKELNDEALEQVAQLAKCQDIDVRFIEVMPIGCGKLFHKIDSDELLERLASRFGKATLDAHKHENGPAVYYQFPNFKGRIGFISPISHQFCSECNRIRLTADGRLKLCLYYENGIELKPALREAHLSDTEIEEMILEGLQRKPRAHHFGEEMENTEPRKMFQIGG